MVSTLEGTTMSDSTIFRPVTSLRPQIAVSEKRKNDILVGLSNGELGLIEGTQLLGLSDAGWTLDLLREAGMWLFTLDETEIQSQLKDGREVLRACLKPEIRAMLEAKRFGKK
jgi:hypothetical protein